MQLSAVDLPQPEGPRSVMNSPPPDGDAETGERDGAAEGTRHAVEAQLAEMALTARRRLRARRQVSLRIHHLILAPPTSSSHFLNAAT